MITYTEIIATSTRPGRDLPALCWSWAYEIAGGIADLVRDYDHYGYTSDVEDRGLFIRDTAVALIRADDRTAGAILDVLKEIAFDAEAPADCADRAVGYMLAVWSLRDVVKEAYI